ncbi:MAG: mechanosensitive ion channel family protein [Phormidesmis sp.]
MKKQFYYWLVYGVGAVLAGTLACVVAFWVTFFPNAALAQLPIQPSVQSAQSASTQPSDTAAQSTVNRLVPDQWIVSSESIDTAPIYLDGRTLFDVSAPAVVGQHPAEVRAQEIQRRLNVLARAHLKTPANVNVEIDEPSKLPVISVDEQLLLTVTNLDAQLGGYASPSDRAFALAETLQDAFRRYQRERQPAFWRRQAKVAAGITCIAILLQWGLRRFDRRLKRRQTRLSSARTHLGDIRRNSHPPMLETPLAADFAHVFDLLKAQLDNRQRRKITEALQALLIIFQLGLWLGTALGLLWLLPYSRWLTTLLLNWIKIPAKILLLSGLAYAAVRLSGLMIDRLSLTLQEGTNWAPDQSKRRRLRFSTFSQVAKGVAGSVIFAITVLLALTISGVEVAPLLAGAGIIGIGISLAAQSLIKDFINGFLILSEDHFGIGDVVTVDGLTGAVEYINLRITQLRDTEGRLITIPNSQISVVQNLSMDWAQVDLSVVVAATADLSEALRLLKETATDLAEDADWQRLILEPPDVLGVESLDHTGITLRLWLKTQPLQQWPVARELRQRIKYVFDEAGIAIGVPQEQIALRWDGAEGGGGLGTAVANLANENDATSNEPPQSQQPRSRQPQNERPRNEAPKDEAANSPTVKN